MIIKWNNTHNKYFRYLLCVYFDDLLYVLLRKKDLLQSIFILYYFYFYLNIWVLLTPKGKWALEEGSESSSWKAKWATWHTVLFRWSGEGKKICLLND